MRSICFAVRLCSCKLRKHGECATSGAPGDAHGRTPVSLRTLLLPSCKKSGHCPRLGAVCTSSKHPGLRIPCEVPGKARSLFSPRWPCRGPQPPPRGRSIRRATLRSRGGHGLSEKPAPRSMSPLASGHPRPGL